MEILPTIDMFLKTSELRRNVATDVLKNVAHILEIHAFTKVKSVDDHISTIILQKSHKITIIMVLYNFVNNTSLIVNNLSLFLNELLLYVDGSLISE